MINSGPRTGKANRFGRFLQRFAFCLSLACCLTALNGCDDGNNGAEDRTAERENARLVVFAAASLTETLSEIGKSYESAHPGTKVVFNFDSSGTLKTQIAEGAVCDIFISAAPKQMDQLDIGAGEARNPKKLDHVLSESRVNLLENKVVLAVSKSGSSELKSFDDLAAALKEHRVFLAIGNSDVPVGQYTLRIFDYYGINMDDLFAHKSLTLGSNVKEVTAQIREGVADAGIVYATDAYSADLRIIDVATAEMAGQVVYPAAVLKNSKHRSQASEFLEYLKSGESKTVFESVGFIVIGR